MDLPMINVQIRVFNGSADKIQILPYNPDRRYIAFYAKTGAPVLSIGDTALYTMSAGQLWEPRIAFTNAISLTGAGTVLHVITSGEVEASYPLLYMTYALNYGSHTLTYTGA